MKTKLYELTGEQVETLKNLLATAYEEDKGNVDPDLHYQKQLSSIYDALILDAPTAEALSKEIHALKNQVQALKMQVEMMGRKI